MSPVSTFNCGRIVTGSGSTIPGSSPGDVVVRRVGLDQGGMRLDAFLAGQPEIPSRPDAKHLIQAGRVNVENRPCKPGQFLRAGQLVRFEPCFANDRDYAAPGPAEVNPDVLHEDPCVLVIAKPAGLVAHPPAARTRRTAASVASWASCRCPGLPVIGGADRPGIVHRLDRETSGVMVLAKTEDAFHFLKGEFKARRVIKRYRAISYGEARFDSDHIERNIATHPTKGDRMVVVQTGGREAMTFYSVVERFDGFTYFDCAPKTGRTHQIRVHLMSVGHGLVGDRFYRSRNHAQATLPSGAPDPQRHCLHAARLEFSHPHTRESMAFEAPLPDDMEMLLGWLRENRGSR